jgi:hypothetical protein
MATWNVDRKKGGTYSFKLDAQGNYGLHKDGFEGVKTLNLPELKKESKATISPVDDSTKKASDQTKEAFGDVQPFYYRGGGADQQYTQQYDMVKDKSLDTDINQTYFKPNMLDVSGEVQPMTKDTVYQDAIMRGEKGIKAEAPTEKKQIGRVNVDQVLNERNLKSTPSVNPVGGVDQMAKDAMSVPGKTTVSDLQKQSQLGVRVPDRISSPLRPAIEKSTLTNTALKKVNTASNVLAKAVGFVMDNTLIGKALSSIKETPVNKHDKSYFNVRPNDSTGQRIAGNPATDLYAGMNRVSAFGNLEKAGTKRIETREKTIARKGYKKGDKFYDDTQKMKEQQKEYRASKNKATVKAAVKKGASIHNPNEMRSAGNGGNGGGGRVICTELHSTGEMSTVDWVRDTRFTFKTLTKSHVKGYLFWAIPTVRHMKKYPLYRKIWKHIAQHRANDIAWRLGESKFDLLGRIYAGIGEPTCWLIGKFVSDKQYNELNLKNWRKA